MPGAKSFLKRVFSLSTMIILVVAFFTTAVSAILGTVLTIQSVGQMKEMAESKTLEFATTVTAMLDGDALKGMKAEDAGTPAYQKAANTINAATMILGVR